MSDVRLWYPQVDVFDSMRRHLHLLMQFHTDPSPERLCIADFYLANLPLLHKTTMRADERNEFRSLKILKEERVFLAYPAAPILFHRMASVQSLATSTLVAKGLISYKHLKDGKVRLTDDGQVFASSKILAKCQPEESAAARFIAKTFANEDDVSIVELRRKTSLRRVAT